ncbi:MAG: restriction endonuclease subunit S [Oscillospiraceae bacterium]|nr:restriction endonuclease subunit S [Oscillospiraceae bacterium]
MLYLSEIKNVYYMTARNFIVSRLKNKVSDAEKAMITVSYLAFNMKVCGRYDILSYDTEKICGSVSDEIFQTACEASDLFSDSQLAALLLFYRFDYSVPFGITALMLSELKYKKHDSILNIFCGDLSAVVDSILINPDIHEITACDTVISGIAKMRADVLNNYFFQKINCCSTGEVNTKFSKIFSCILLSDRPYIRIRPQVKYDKYPFDMKNISYEWLANITAGSFLSDDGKIVMLTNTGAVSNINEERIREYFIRNGLVKKVTALPEKLLGYTAIRTLMILFSRNNKNIEFADAHKYFTSGRRMNCIEEKNISEINSADSVTLSIRKNDFSENHFSLDPAAYLKKAEPVTNSVPFISVIKNITRGIQLNANELDELETDGTRRRGVRYLRISDIRHCLINDNLPVLSRLPEGAEKYLAHNGDLIISKTGNPAKTAVADEESEGILITGNMYLIRPDNEKANPYFIQAYLNSEAGNEQIMRISGGSTISTISLAALKNMMIPFPEKEKQNEIAERFRLKLNEIKDLSERLEKAEGELKNIM